MSSLLNVQNLRVSYFARTGQRSLALTNISFALAAGETLGVLGESGSGKSTLAAALLQVLPPNGKIEQGTVFFEGQDLLKASSREMERIRGGRMAIVFQEPLLALHPTIRAGEQVSDVVAAHHSSSRRIAREGARQILGAVFPSDSGRIFDSFPHQLSGGQRARVLIAQAIACSPSLVIADEPTASLDPETQQEILALFRALRQKLNLSLIWITHNPALLEGFADRVMVLYAGRVVELGPAKSVLSSPRHPYTQALLRSLPPAAGEEGPRHKRLSAIPGEAPDSATRGGASYCWFEPRCPQRMNICKEREPELVQIGSTHESLCFKQID